MPQGGGFSVADDIRVGISDPAVPPPSTPSYYGPQEFGRYSYGGRSGRYSYGGRQEFYYGGRYDPGLQEFGRNTYYGGRDDPRYQQEIGRSTYNTYGGVSSGAPIDEGRAPIVEAPIVEAPIVEAPAPVEREPEVVGSGDRRRHLNDESGSDASDAMVSNARGTRHLLHGLELSELDASELLAEGAEVATGSSAHVASHRIDEVKQSEASGHNPKRRLAPTPGFGSGGGIIQERGIFEPRGYYYGEGSGARAGAVDYGNQQRSAQIDVTMSRGGERRVFSDTHTRC